MRTLFLYTPFALLGVLALTPVAKAITYSEVIQNSGIPCTPNSALGISCDKQGNIVIIIKDSNDLDAFAEELGQKRKRGDLRIGSANMRGKEPDRWLAINFRRPSLHQGIMTTKEGAAAKLKADKEAAKKAGKEKL